MTDSLLNKLLTADVVCRDCGLKYGKYSVGCSSVWIGECNVCGEEKSITEVRDYGYLSKGINELRGTIKEQSKKVADYMMTVGPIMTDDEVEDLMTVTYERGKITLKLTEEEVGFLHECLDTIQEHHLGLDEKDPIDVALFESIELKIVDLYEDHCVKYRLSPAMEAYHKQYGSFGVESPEEEARWAGFRDAFELLNSSESQ